MNSFATFVKDAGMRLHSVVTVLRPLVAGLFGTVGKLARQLRAIDRIAPKLKDGGLVRKVQVDRERQRRAVGLAVAHRRISAFGGLLYGVAAIAHELSTAASAGSVCPVSAAQVAVRSSSAMSSPHSLPAWMWPGQRASSGTRWPPSQRLPL